MPLVTWSSVVGNSVWKQKWTEAALGFVLQKLKGENPKPTMTKSHNFSCTFKLKKKFTILCRLKYREELQVSNRFQVPGKEKYT